MSTSIPASAERSTGPEVLAPAGNAECLKAAIAAGADAVYFGLRDYNARIRAHNFDLGELPEVMKDLRRWGIKGYLTFNTLIFREEVAAAKRSLSSIVRAAPDGIIVQDLGVLRWLREMAPHIPLHASTQMTIAGSCAVRLAAHLGCKRVILARELTCGEIAQIRRETETELEVFVHGALCVSYSGQCLSSEAWGGRSANRGQCAQACRLPYDLLVDGLVREMGDRAYLLSPRDLEGYRRVPELVRLGISALKIEGRMKSPEYVAASTRLYRAAVDRALVEAAQGQAMDQRSEAELEAMALESRQVFSRGTCEGFLGGINHQVMVDGESRSHRGLFVGTIQRVEKDRTGPARSILVKKAPSRVSESLKPGDGLLLAVSALEEDEVGGRILSVESIPSEEWIRIRFPRESLPDLAKVRPGTGVYRTDDPRLMERLRMFIHTPMAHRTVALTAEVEGAEGEMLRLRLIDSEGRNVLVTSNVPLQPARSHGVGDDQLSEHIGRMGGTRYRLASISRHLASGLFLPVSELNRMRREAVAMLEELRARPQTQPAQPRIPSSIPEPQRSSDLVSPVLWAVRRAEIATTEPTATGSAPGRTEAADFRTQVLILCRSREQVRAAVEAGARRIVLDFLDLVGLKETAHELRRDGVRVTLALPRIQKPGEERLESFFVSLVSEEILVRNLGSLERLRALKAERDPGGQSLPDFPLLIGDVSLNAVNADSITLLLDLGLDRVAPGCDLNGDQLGGLIGELDPQRLELPLHHHLPIFHTEHCVFAACLSNGTDFRTCGRPCDRHQIELRDRAGQSHHVVADVGCRNTVFSARPQSSLPYWKHWRSMGVSNFRLELMDHDGHSTARTIEIYRSVLEGRKEWSAALAELKAEGCYGVSTGSPEPPRKMDSKPVGGKRPPRAYSRPRSSSSSSLRPR